MPTKVEVYIRGLALCYIDPTTRNWNVQFVSDPHHPLTLSDPTGIPVALRVQGQDFECTFTGEFTGRESGARPAELFNLNGSRAHQGRLRKVNRNMYNTSKILMKLPPAGISVRGIALDYWIQEVGSSQPTSIGPVSTIIRFDFEFTSPALQVRVANSTRERYNETFQASSNTLRFKFDNHCTSCARNDSLELYDVVRDGNGSSERRFVTGDVDHSGNVPGHSSPLVEGGDTEKDAPPIVTAPYGNCDPMGSEPPPGD